MTRIFFNQDAMFDYLIGAVNNHHLAPIDIASYGMYLGITEDGKDWSDIYPSSARMFINAVAQKSHRIVIGLPYYTECIEKCVACRLQYDKRLYRTDLTAKKLKLNIRYISDCHLKYYKVGNQVILGGMNLNASGWIDASILTKSTISLRNMYRRLWKSASPTIDTFYKCKENNHD